MIDSLSVRQENERTSEFYRDMMLICDKMSKASGGIVRLAFNEKDDSTEKEEEACHFLKVDEKRVSCDIELMKLKARIAGTEFVAAEFVQIIILSIRDRCSESYDAAKQDLIDLKKHFRPEYGEEWEAIFAGEDEAA